MTTLELVEALAAKGVQLYAEGGDLKYRGPRSALAPETIARLKAHKPEIVAALNATPTPPPQEPPASEEPAALSAFAKRKLEQASEMGLVAMWSRHFGFVSIHDPTTGEWHDLRTEDAPGWAKREARWRKGKKNAYSLTSREVEERRASERADSHPAVTDKGIVFEDYIEET